MVGKTDYDLSPKSLADMFRKVDTQVIKSGKIIEAEETVTKANAARIMLSKSEFRTDNPELQRDDPRYIDAKYLKIAGDSYENIAEAFRRSKNCIVGPIHELAREFIGE